MPTPDREVRPAPPAGLEVLTVPEAVAYARKLAEERGDGKARIQRQDIWRDIRDGQLVLGRDAYWVSLAAHPKGGYWVVTRDALERRIRERLRGRGRPRKSAKATPVPAASAASNENTPGRTDQAVTGENPSPPAVIEGAGAGDPPTHAHVVLVEGERGPEGFPVADPSTYQMAVAEALALEGHERGLLRLCRCGWAGQEAAMARRPYPDGQGWQPVCPRCGRSRWRTDVAMVRVVVQELPAVQRDLHRLARRTRNETWKRELRKLLGRLELLARQAAVEEPVTPGVSAKVARVIGEARAILDGALVLPTVMRNKPGWREIQALVEPRVRPVMEQLFPVRFVGEPVIEIRGAVERDGNAALARAVLLGEIPATRVWPTLLWLTRTGVLGAPDGLAQTVEVLASLPPETLAAAGVLERRIRARMGTRDTFWSAVRALVAKDAWYRREWDRFGQAAEQIGELREQMHNLLRGEARRQVAARIEAETERLAIMASEEAERSGIDPLRVVARWVRQPDIFGGKAWMKVIAYQLAQRLASSTGSDATE